jgi:peroxiredoxin Q/BCP
MTFIANWQEPSMKLKPGDPVIDLQLPALDNSVFNTDSLRGRRYLLSFFRFAGCPFCNIRMHELVTRYNELPEGFTIVAVFDAPLDDLQRHETRHRAVFPILADSTNTYYKKYSIDRSVWGMLKGAVVRFPALLQALRRGYFPTTIKGKLHTLPADFLVDEQGRIQTAHYGRDLGDHLSFEKVKAFAGG